MGEPSVPGADRENQHVSGLYVQFAASFAAKD
jgi:hypothetical protein